MARTELDEQTEAVRALARVSRLLERSSGELSLAHYRVLAAISEGHERASRLADRLALGKPTISASVDALCRRGLIVRADAVDDQRVTTLRLTPAGEHALHEVETAMRARVSTLLSHTDDPTAVARALRQLGTALDRIIAERSAAR